MGVPQGCALPAPQRPERCKLCALSEEDKKRLCSWYREMQHKVWSRWQNQVQPGQFSRRSLHRAILRLLYETGGDLTAQQIADEVNARDLYRRAGGWPISAHDVRKRVTQYGRFFTIGDGRGQQTISINATGKHWLELGQ